MKFWDSSALVPLFLGQAASTWAISVYKRDRSTAVWWAASVECKSAIARLERSGTLKAAEATKARRRLSEAESGWLEIEPTDDVRLGARRLLRVHDLRAADALQLAAALTLAGGVPAKLGFVSLDDRLSAAARKEGFEILTR